MESEEDSVEDVAGSEVDVSVATTSVDEVGLVAADVGPSVVAGAFEDVVEVEVDEGVAGLSAAADTLVEEVNTGDAVVEGGKVEADGDALEVAAVLLVATSALLPLLALMTVEGDDRVAHRCATRRRKERKFETGCAKTYSHKIGRMLGLPIPVTFVALL
ncbi:hypothetical protein HK405_013002 [Cladochytrium tenue]|nr:hypothetical protein HK405_013002 [Cladochytrium tenue]